MVQFNAFLISCILLSNIKGGLCTLDQNTVEAIDLDQYTVEAIDLDQNTVEKKAIDLDQNTVGAIESVFGSIGFSPVCVSQTLAICEMNSQNLSLFDEINILLNEIKKVQKQQNNIVYPRNCADLLENGHNTTGVQTIYPYKCCPNWPVKVWCDQETDGGGWTVIQRREDLPIRENFFRKWTEYKLGFGNITGEFWLGLEIIHALVSDTLMEFRIDLEDFEGEKRWAKYDYFYISDESENFTLDLGDYSGNAGDSLTRTHNGRKFSTKDRDNDEHSGNCADSFKGGWWYGACLEANLNRLAHKGKTTSHAEGINWYAFHGYDYSLRKTSLNIRPKL